MDVRNQKHASYSILQNYVRNIVQQRGWTGTESAANDDLTRLNNLLSNVEGILLNVFPDGSIHSIYGPMEKFIEYSNDEINNIYELLDSDCSDEVRCILSQHNQSVAGDMTGRKIRFRIKPAPRTPLQNHKFCLFDCFLNKFSQSSSSFYSLLCLRYDWIQLTITTSLPREKQDIEFWSTNDDKKCELNWIYDVEIHKPPNQKVRNPDTQLFMDSFKNIIFRELIGSYSTESMRRMNNMWHTLRLTPSRDVDKRTSVLNITQLEQSSMEVQQHERESFLSKIRATGLSEDEVKNVKLILNTSLRIVVNKKSKDKEYVTLEEASNASAELNFLMEFAHRISIPNEVLQIAARSLPKKQAAQQMSPTRSPSSRRSSRNSPRNAKGTVIYKLLSDDNFSNNFYTEYLHSQRDRSKKSPIRSPGSEGRKSDRSVGSPMISEKDTPILKELLRKNDEDSTSKSRRGTKRPKDDDFISGPRETGLNDGPPPPPLPCRPDSGSNLRLQQPNQTSPNSAAEQEKKREAEERNERYFKFVTNFSKRQKLPASETTPPAQPIQRALSQIAEAKMNQSSGFSESDSQIRRMLVSKDGPAVFQPNRGSQNNHVPKRLNRSGSVPNGNQLPQQQQMHHQQQQQQQQNHQNRQHQNNQNQQQQQAPQLSPQPGMNNQFNPAKALKVVNVVQVSPGGYQQNQSPQQDQMGRRHSYGDINSQNFNSPMSPPFVQNADYQMTEGKNQFMGPPNRSRNTSLSPSDMNGQLQPMKSPLQSPMSPIGAPISPYASSLPSPSGQMMNQGGMGQQKSFFGQPTSQMNGHNGHNIQSTKASQMLNVQGSQKAAQSYPNIIGILNPNQSQQQQQFQQPINNFNQSQHHRIPMSLPMTSYPQQMSPSPLPLPTQRINNNHQQQYSNQMATQKHSQPTMSNDLKDLSLPLLGSNDFSSDLGCLDFLDNEMSLHNAYIDNANKLIQ